MADLSVNDVTVLLAAQGVVGIGENDLVETTQRLNVLMDRLDRLEENASFGDVEGWLLFEPDRASGE